jgi:hypothetical protein
VPSVRCSHETFEGHEGRLALSLAVTSLGFGSWTKEQPTFKGWWNIMEPTNRGMNGNEPNKIQKKKTPWRLLSHVDSSFHAHMPSSSPYQKAFEMTILYIYHLLTMTHIWLRPKIREYPKWIKIAILMNKTMISTVNHRVWSNRPIDSTDSSTPDTPWLWLNIGYPHSTSRFIIFLYGGFQSHGGTPSYHPF